MAKAHAEFIVACFVVSSKWEKMSEDEKLQFYNECVKRFGVDVIRQTVTELTNEDKLLNVIDYCREQLSSSV